MKIIWTHTAKRTFQKILDYLFETWTNKELKNFIEETNNLLDQVKNNPYQFKASKITTTVRKGYIN
jgi:plasmid stabilization system protein ParE